MRGTLYALFWIAGERSGSGKTSISISIAAALAKKYRNYAKVNMT